MSFVDYATQLLKHYSVIERLRNPVAIESKVQRLVDGIKISNNTTVGLAVEHAENNLLGNWNAAVSYLSGKMANVFPEKDKHKVHKTRRASEVNSGCGRGGRGRGHGRGRGQGPCSMPEMARSFSMMWMSLTLPAPSLDLRS